MAISRSTSFHQSHSPGCSPCCETKNRGFKAFIITSIFCTAIAMVSGILALSHCYGAFSDVPALEKLSVMGEANSYLLALGGAALFALSLVAWGCLLTKERDPSSRFSKWS